MPNSFKTSLNDMKKHPRYPKEKTNAMASGVTEKDTSRRNNEERKLALQQDLDILRKSLRHEESVHRALERAFRRPLGVLPRLPPYLPQYTLELLAEVAVLEEEVVRLEKQVVDFRQALYQEAVYISSCSLLSSKRQIENGDMDSANQPSNQHYEQAKSSSLESLNDSLSAKAIKNSLLRQCAVESEFNHSGFSSEEVNFAKQALHRRSCLNGKENQLLPRSKATKQTPQKVPQVSPFVKRASCDQRFGKKREIIAKKQLLHPEYDASSKKVQKCVTTENSVVEDRDDPTKLSEDLLKCLLSIFVKIGKQSGRKDFHNLSVVSTSPCDASKRSNMGVEMDCRDKADACDPYGICAEFGERDIGHYKNLCELSSSAFDLSRVSDAVPLVHRLKTYLLQLQSVELQGLTQQQKLSFWINIYNSCMMNAFLEYGIPDGPHTIVALMRKAVLNIGGHMLNAFTIEHFILRQPSHSKPAQSKGGKNDDRAMDSVFGLDWPEPLVTFALCCGSWSSPAVRIYTAMKVEDELESAKRDYLQAAIGISSRNNKLVIPKLLDWYLLDFAKDLDSLSDWICLQLPNELREEAMKCLERGRKDHLSQAIQVMPYEFSFRYLLVST